MKLGTMLRITDISDVAAQFARLKEYGFPSCQIVYKPREYTSEDAAAIKKAASDAEVEISAQFCGYYDNDTVWDNYYGFLTSGLGVETYRKERLDYLKKAASFAKEVGISDIVVHAGFVPNNPFSRDYPLLLASVESLCRHCESMGINVLLETGGESAVAMLRLIEDVGRTNLFVNLDPANMLMYGYANPVDALYTIGKYVRNIHGKDGCPPTNSRKLGEEKPVGEGMVDFHTMLRRLKVLGYDRYITIERETTGDKQIEDILGAKAYFEKIISEIW